MASRPAICIPIVDADLAAIRDAAPLADFFEVRIDLISKGWQEVAKRLKKPWLACNRLRGEGGKWQGSETARVVELLKALDLGARIIDIELAAPDLTRVVAKIKGQAECLISYHNNEETPPLARLREIVRRELAAGADICKVVTTARTFKDNITVLRLIRDFPEARIVALAMGDAGQVSRVLCPLAGGYFTYAAIAGGKESAPGQITAGELRKIYGVTSYGR